MKSFIEALGEKRAAVRRVNNGRTGFQMAYEMTLALFLLSVGLLSIRGASADLGSKSDSQSKGATAIECVIKIVNKEIKVEFNGQKKNVQSLVAAANEVIRISAAEKSKSCKVVLAPTADAFAKVPAWYRIVRSNLPQSISVGVAIP